MILRSILIVAISFLFSSPVLAAHLNLAWNPNSEPDLAGYRIYYGTSPGHYTDLVDVGDATFAQITGLSEETEYFLSLTAYDIYGNESDFSVEVSAFASPGDPQPTEESQATSSSIVFHSSSKDGCFITTTTSP